MQFCDCGPLLGVSLSHSHSHTRRLSGRTEGARLENKIKRERERQPRSEEQGSRRWLLPFPKEEEDTQHTQKRQTNKATTILPGWLNGRMRGTKEESKRRKKGESHRDCNCYRDTPPFWVRANANNDSIGHLVSTIDTVHQMAILEAGSRIVPVGPLWAELNCMITEMTAKPTQRRTARERGRKGR
ncbi:hypothetical protein QQF64_034305 [Cirrhinus molitorella]|uniref:Uncharacterized protein n=1 Tax=Cirrhinus molitorella TaxID=172907 RepID=A0ABR3L1S3_9TELE